MKKAGIIRTLMHLILTCMTGGLWLVFLLLRYLLTDMDSKRRA